MNVLKDVASELTGMFLGDARLSLAVLCVVAAAAAVADLTALGALAGGGVLLGGCLLLLVESVRRAASKAGRG